MNSYTVNLEQFEGTLDLLLHLLTKREVDVSQVEVTKITHPFLESFDVKSSGQFDLGADFILLTSQIALMKSRALVPRSQMDTTGTLDIEEDPKFDIIHHLIDYCRFKEAAGLFSDLEIKQEDYYPRGIQRETHTLDGQEIPGLPLGLQGITLEELKSVFQDILKSRQVETGFIEEEEYRVQDQLLNLRKLLKVTDKIIFSSLFLKTRHKIEMIVIFLATLELVKLGEIKIVKQDSEIVLYGQRN